MKTKVKIPAGKIVLDQNTAEIEKYRNTAAETQQNLQNVVTEYQKLGLGTPTLQETKHMILQGAEKLVREKLAGTEPVSIGGLKISAQKFREMLELPDLTSLERALHKAKGFNEGVIIWNDGEILLNTEALEAYADRNTTYATTEAEKEVFLVAKDIQQNLEYLQQKYGLNLISRDSGYALKQDSYFTPADGSRVFSSILDIHLLKRSLRDKGLS